jgi:hypothetical protein
LGVPLALAALAAFLLFRWLRAAVVAMEHGLRGDQTVFQFTTREIAMFTMMIALACSWFAYHLAVRR